MNAALWDEVCAACGAALIDTGDEMRCVECYPMSFAETEARMHSEIAPWLEAQIAQNREIDLRVLAHEAADHFLMDGRFLETTVAGLIKAAAREEAQRLLRQQRGGKNVLLGDMVVSRDNLEQRARRSALWAWTETVGQRTIRLPDMTRADVLHACADRRARGIRELTIAKFWEGVAGKLKDGQTIGERFSPEEIEAMTRKRQTLDRPDLDLPALRAGGA